MSATVIDVCGARTTSPPATVTPYSRAHSARPAYRTSTSSTGISGGSASVTSAKSGVPPIAAMSLTFTASAFQPTSAHGACPATKCTPSTIVSVVAMRYSEPARQTAASSPMPTIRSGEPSAGSMPVSRSMRPNSPRSDTFTATLYEALSPAARRSPRAAPARPSLRRPGARPLRGSWAMWRPVRRRTARMPSDFAGTMSQSMRSPTMMHSSGATPSASQAWRKRRTSGL